jgi:hypothetical protein
MMDLVGFKLASQLFLGQETCFENSMATLFRKGLWVSSPPTVAAAPIACELPPSLLGPSPPKAPTRARFHTKNHSSKIQMQMAVVSLRSEKTEIPHQLDLPGEFRQMKTFFP